MNNAITNFPSFICASLVKRTIIFSSKNVALAVPAFHLQCSSFFSRAESRLRERSLSFAVWYNFLVLGCLENSLRDSDTFEISGNRSSARNPTLVSSWKVKKRWVDPRRVRFSTSFPREVREQGLWIRIRDFFPFSPAPSSVFTTLSISSIVPSHSKRWGSSGESDFRRRRHGERFFTT